MWNCSRFDVEAMPEDHSFRRLATGSERRREWTIQADISTQGVRALLMLFRYCKTATWTRLMSYPTLRGDRRYETH